jgi:hypothetical protein
MIATGGPIDAQRQCTIDAQRRVVPGEDESGQKKAGASISPSRRPSPFTTEATRHPREFFGQPLQTPPM